MRLRSGDLLVSAALVAGALFLYALQNSRLPTRLPAPTPSPSRGAIGVPLAPAVPPDVRLPSKPPDRMLDRYRQFGLPAATDMLLYFPIAPAAPPMPLPTLLKKL